MQQTWLLDSHKSPISILQSREIQRITGLSSNIMSSASKFRLLFDGESTDYIFADPLKNGDCRNAAVEIKEALEALDSVSGSLVVTADPADAANPAHECTWTLTFQGMSGNLPAMTIATPDSAAFDVSATHAHVGNLVDTFTVSTVTDGAWNILKTELEKLVTVGQVTVASVGPSNAGSGCQWAITYDTNTGTPLPALQATMVTTDVGATMRVQTAADVTCTLCRYSNTLPLGGDFAIEFMGQRTQYLPHDVEADELKSALESLTTIGTFDPLPLSLSCLFSLSLPSFLRQKVRSMSPGPMRMKTWGTFGASRLSLKWAISQPCNWTPNRWLARLCPSPPMNRRRACIHRSTAWTVSKA
jgi:hypothetical protein